MRSLFWLNLHYTHLALYFLHEFDSVNIVSLGSWNTSFFFLVVMKFEVCSTDDDPSLDLTTGTLLGYFSYLESIEFEVKL